MFAAFHIPDLPMAAALLEHPEWREKPCAILRDPTDKEDAKIPLLSLSGPAWQTGIVPGWPLNRALVRCPDLTVIPRLPEKEVLLRQELVNFADRFSADVEITSEDTVLLDLAGTKRGHFQGMETLPDSDVEVCHAIADTPDLAHFAVQERCTRGRFISSTEIATLPLSLLAKLDGNHSFLQQLDLLGLRTLGDYCKLPRQGLTERFGAQAGHWQDIVSGKTRRLLKLHRPPESFLQSIDFDDPIHSSEALSFILNRLLHVLGSRLAARHLATSLLQIHLELEEGSMCREIHLPEPLSDPAALLKPILTLVESLILPSPVTGLQLDATAAFPLSSQKDWTKRQLANPGRWADTLARLEALVGNGNIGIPSPLEVHRPDAFTMLDAAAIIPATPATPATPASGTLPVCSIPLRRFRPPLKIAVAFDPLPGRHPLPLALLTGPHCGRIQQSQGPFVMSGEGWNPDTTWHRLEWDIEVEKAPLLRLVFQTGKNWQLDGIYS